MELTDKKPFSNSQIDRLGDAIRDGIQFDEDFYYQLEQWNEALLAKVREIVIRVLNERTYLGIRPVGDLGEDPKWEYASRVKSIDTLREKLQRLNSRLSTIQDLAGARVNIDGSLLDQQHLVEDLKSAFESQQAKVKVKNYLVESQFGYRAIHLHINSPAGRVELQVRTSFQEQWANVNEALGDVYGRDLRYREIDLDEDEHLHRVVQSQKTMSMAIRELEELENEILASKSEDSAVREQWLEIRAKLNRELGSWRAETIRSLQQTQREER